MQVIGVILSIVSIAVFSVVSYKANKGRESYEATLRKLRDSYQERLIDISQKYQQKLEEIIRENKGN